VESLLGVGGRIYEVRVSAVLSNLGRRGAFVGLFRKKGRGKFDVQQVEGTQYSGDGKGVAVGG